MSEKPKSSQKFKPKKLIFRIVVVIVAIAAAVGVYFGVQYLIKINKENADIKIGDVVIRREQVLKNASDMSNALGKDKSITFGEGTPEDIARKDLILNALLKKQTSKCKDKYGEITSVDLYKELNYGGNKTDNEMSAVVDLFRKEKGEFEFVRLENLAYKTKWTSCIIGTKDVFKVSIILDMPYFQSMDEATFKAEALKSKETLEKKFLQMFKDGKTKEEIASYAEYNTLDGIDEVENADIGSGPVTFAFLDRWGHDVRTSTLYNEDKTLRTGLLNEVSFNDRVKDMNVGDYTHNALIGKNGEIALFRVEKSTGEFATWDDFYQKGVESEKIYHARNDNANAVGINNSESWSCGPNGQQLFRNNHYVTAVFTFRLRGSTGVVSGHKVHSRQGYGTFRNGQQSCGLNADSTSDSNGQAEIRMNCLAVLPGEAGRYTYDQHGKAAISFAPASGYRFVETYATYSGTTGGDRPSISHYNYEGGLQVFHGANQTSTTQIDVIIERDVQPPDPKPDSPRQTSTVKTQVRLNNTGNWQNGTIVAPVGSIVNFKHTINGNFSSNWSNYFIDWQESNGQVSKRNVNRSGISLGSNASGDVVVQGDTTGLKNNVGVTPIKITHADVGKTICENMNYTWRLEYYYQKGDVRNGVQVHDRTRDASRDQRGSGSSNQACVYVPYNYELTPCINGPGSMCGGVDIPGEPGESIPNTPEVDNPNGNTPSRPDTQWIITTWTVGGGYENRATPNNIINNSNGNTCSVYAGAYGVPLTNCRVSERGNQPFDPGKKTRVGIGGLSIPDDAPLGSRYCIALSVSPYKLGANESQAAQNQKVGTQWRHSAPFCLKATKKPKFQVWGNGIYSRGGIVTSRSNIKGGVFGSWVEYEAIAGGKVNGFTSESSNTGNRLTFANDKSGTKGNWGEWIGDTKTDLIIENINGRYRKTRDDKTVVREAQEGIYGGHDGNTTPNTHTRIIDSKGMFLTGNIISRGPAATDRIRAFQQTIIIVDGDLYISNEVTRIDAWLIVKGKIVTCATGQSENPAIVNNNNCGKTLQVNGPIIANNMKSWRTGGSEFGNPGSPSETYNQRADVYLWAYAQGTSSNKVVTTYTKEIPVRY